MRKLGIASTLALGITLSAGAARAQQYGMAGCGLGSVLFGNDNSMLMQIIAATFNGTVGNQTFGITSGTSNCVSGGAVAANREQLAFAEVNFRDLKRNMANGGGEYLDTFATLLGCEQAAVPALGNLTQSRFEIIFADDQTTPVQMLQTVKQEISAASLPCSDERALARAEGRAVQVARN